jgi:hypothetical protein
VTLGWLNPVMARKHAVNAEGYLNCDPGVIAFLQQGLRLYNAGFGSSERICAFTFLDEPPSLAAAEITDKAYTNRRAVLINRAAQMELRRQSCILLILLYFSVRRCVSVWHSWVARMLQDSQCGAVSHHVFCR